MLSRHPSLWSYIVEWDALATAGKKWTWLNEKEVVLLDPALVLAVLHDREQNYEDQSAFFRTSAHSPLSPQLRRQMSGALIRVLTAREHCPRRVLPKLLGTSHRVPGLGVRLIATIFAEELGLRLSTAAEVVEEYLSRIIIEHDLRGSRLVPVTSVFTRLIARLADWLEFEYRPQNPPRNVFDIALSGRPELNFTEVAELSLRLVLSVTGFTGIALEWALVLGARGNTLPRRGADHLLKETQRLFPTAWRLGRRARLDHTLGELKILAGTTVILSTATGQRSENEWHDAKTLFPQRWDTPTRESFYAPFGQGMNSCPAKALAPRMLGHIIAATTDKMTVSYTPHLIGKKPTVGSLLGLPRGRLTFHVRATHAER
ncbi:cytochrome P450 [Allokutzneria sp. NRRL B-24872]|uniref:cytochrome P450 n=1 Tax=Allokutzneria sp. NRRL B-24872 TaxID=1137961 RepID=UPI0011786333|nr:cytochrome P450 [Allokutzneria sp. NRRL B-24872]